MSTSSDAGTTISNGVMVSAVIFLFVIVVFIFFLYLYAKRYWAVAPGHRIIFVVDHLPHRGLDASILRSLPVSVFRTGDFAEGLECAVCLSDVSEGEEVRLLPKCNHVFHLECIDMWLHSHSTCPLCRCPLVPLEIPTDSQLLPTNVLFWGPRSNVGSSSNGALVIDIPLISPLPSSRLPIGEEEIRTPTSSTSRLRSLGKMLSIRGKSSSDDDIEQGVVGEAPPKTPRNS